MVFERTTQDRSRRAQAPRFRRRTQGRERRPRYHARGWILTRGELAFFRALTRAAGTDFLAFAKVRLADVIRCDATEPGWSVFAAISQKHLDFVLCDPHTTRIRAAVELDDRSHEAADRRRRDAFVNRVLRSAGVPLLRIRAAARYDAAEIAEAIRDAVAAGRARPGAGEEGRAAFKPTARRSRYAASAA